MHIRVSRTRAIMTSNCSSAGSHYHTWLLWWSLKLAHGLGARHNKTRLWGPISGCLGNALWVLHTYLPSELVTTSFRNSQQHCATLTIYRYQEEICELLWTWYFPLSWWAQNVQITSSQNMHLLVEEICHTLKMCCPQNTWELSAKC